MRRSHAKIDIVFFNVDRSHRIGTCRIHCKDCIVLMSKCTDFPDRIENSGSRFIVSGVNKSDIGIVFKCFFYLCKIGALVHGKCKIDVRQTVIFAYFNRSCAVRAVVYHKYFLSFGKKAVDADINIYGAASAKKYGCVFIQIAVNNFHKVFSQPFHKSAEFFFSRTDIRYNL